MQTRSTLKRDRGAAAAPTHRQPPTKKKAIATKEDVDAEFCAAIDGWLARFNAREASRAAADKVQRTTEFRQRILDTVALVMRDLPHHAVIPDLIRSLLDSLECIIETGVIASFPATEDTVTRMESVSTKMESVTAEVHRIHAVLAQDAKTAEATNDASKKILAAQQAQLEQLARGVLLADDREAKVTQLANLVRSITARELATATYKRHLELADAPAGEKKLETKLPPKRSALYDELAQLAALVPDKAVAARIVEAAERTLAACDRCKTRSKVPLHEVHDASTTTIYHLCDGCCVVCPDCSERCHLDDCVFDEDTGEVEYGRCCGL